MNIFNKVTLNSLKRNKTRTAVTVIGITLSAAMICAVTTFVSSFHNFVIENEIYTEGNWHGRVTGTDSFTYGEIKSDGQTEDTFFMQQLGYAHCDSTNEYKPYIYLLGASEGAKDSMPIHITAGRYPESANEILLPEHLIANSTASYSVGDTLTLELGDRMWDGYVMTQNNPAYTYTDGEEVLNDETIAVKETRVYTVVGIYERPSFEEYSAPGYTAVTLGEMTDGYLYDVYFRMKEPKDIYEFMKAGGYGDERNTELLLYLGTSRFSNYETMLLSLAAIVILLIMFGSVSLIYNAFSISVSERTKQFGLLSSVGATKRQLRKTVFFESAAVSALGIPTGIAAGIAGIGVTLLFIGSKFKSIGFATDLTLSVTPQSVIAAACVAFITVMISAWVPSKRGSKVSAVEAIRQTNDITASPRQLKTSKLTYKLFGLPGILASKHYKRSKRKYRATVLSLFMSIVLFVSAASFTDYLTEMVSGGFNTYGYDLRFSCNTEDLTDITKDELLKTVQAQKCVTDATYEQQMFLVMNFSQNVLSKDAIENLDVLTVGESTDGTASFPANLYFINDGTYKKLLSQYGLSEKVFADPDAPLGIMFDGGVSFDYEENKYVSMNIFRSDDIVIGIKYITEYDGYNITDSSDGTVRYEKNDGSGEYFELSSDEAYNIVTLRSGKTVYDEPYFLESDGRISLVYPESVKEKLLPNMDTESYPYRFMITSSDPSQSEGALQLMLNEKGFGSSGLYNYSENVESNRNIVTVIKVFSYGFIVLISLIAAANVFNTISTNINLRRREFAMLKSVGMSSGGFNRMMNYECLLYGSRALLYGIPVSIGITYLIYLAIMQGYSTDFRLPLTAVGISALSVFAVVFVTMMYAMHKIKKDNPIDALKNENI